MKFHELEKKLLDPSALGQNFAKVSKEHSDMAPIVAFVDEYRKSQREMAEIDEMLPTITDKDMKEMMESERFDLSKKIPEIEHKVKLALLPRDAADEKSAILEVRAGTGGEEAALFAYKLF